MISRATVAVHTYSPWAVRLFSHKSSWEILLEPGLFLNFFYCFPFPLAAHDILYGWYYFVCRIWHFHYPRFTHVRYIRLMCGLNSIWCPVAGSMHHVHTNTPICFNMGGDVLSCNDGCFFLRQGGVFPVFWCTGPHRGQWMQFSW